MSLIFESELSKQQPAGAYTHVLLVGCGAYPGLAAAALGGLAPLTSPRISAHAMADWFLGGADAMPTGQGGPSSQAFYHPDAPLGSLAMLTSPGGAYTTPAGSEMEVARPTLKNIKSEYLAWLKRLGSNPGSRGVFYFCGHGLSNGITQFLVADDYGEEGDADDDWPSLFHVSNTCQAAIRKTPANLFFFLDACLEINEEITSQLDEPRGLIKGTRTGKPLTSNWSVLRAATTNRKAYAPKGQVARFTDALLQALRGRCGTQSDHGTHYEVCASNLRDATSAILQHSQRSMTGGIQALGPTDGEGGWDVPLHVQTDRPTVLVELDILPSGYRTVGQVFAAAPNSKLLTKALGSGPASFVGANGEWTLGTASTNGQYAEQVFSNQLLTRAVHSRCFHVKGGAE